MNSNKTIETTTSNKQYHTLVYALSTNSKQSTETTKDEVLLERSESAFVKKYCTCIHYSINYTLLHTHQSIQTLEYLTMQILLTDTEYYELKSKADRADSPQNISLYDLQRLCSNYVTLYSEMLGGNFSCVNGEPRGIFPYCTDCPVLGICPSTNKEYAK